MAASEDGSGCLVSRGRSQSDPSVLTDSSATSSTDAGENPDEMDQTPPVRSEYLVSGIRTPPVRRNSKLATLGRIFKPWKWRKKKNEKLKQTTSALEKKMSSRQGREELIKQGLLEMMEQDAESKMSSPDGGPQSTQSEPSTPKQETLTANDVQPGSPLATGADQASPDEPLPSDAHLDNAGGSAGPKDIHHVPSVGLGTSGPAEAGNEDVPGPTGPPVFLCEGQQARIWIGDREEPSPEASVYPTKLQEQVMSPLFAFEATKVPSACSREEADPSSLLPTTDELSQASAGSDSLESPPRPLERSMGQLPSPPLLPTPPPKVNSKTTKNVTGQAVLFQGPSVKSTDPPLRGQLSTPTGSPHLTTVHRPLPPSRVMEELHRALATKQRQDSFQGRESKVSPKKRVDVRLSRTSSMERGKEREETWSFDGVLESKRATAKESEENKENLMASPELADDLLLYQDEEVLNDSVISGTLPRKCKKELLAVKLRNRPSKQELEDRNIFPRRTDEERQEIRQQIEMKLSKRLSQRPAVEELERRNILKQRNDQTEQEERREIKQRLTRKLNQRPTVDELRDRKILIRFSDYVEVAKAQDYDRRADKPWTRLSAADKVQNCPLVGVWYLIRITKPAMQGAYSYIMVAITYLN
ncbi:Phosphatase and actin regulator 3 [Sciurus carolinensis]|uniref:Phosphatase and actin regulator n=1 Tax=Sciurus carolinensis TaxID=30640 RepID=A0AA41N4V8_SCICA|nr:Phosphatase and actin regulator 3 [Sciurus carolinensis]